MSERKQRLTFTLKELQERKLEELKGRPLDVVIVGSGPASIAVADFLYTEYPDADFTITILERGNILTTTHISNTEVNDPLRPQGRSFSTRGKFIQAHETYPWKGHFEKHGMLVFALGGRSIVAGALLRRFDSVDFDCAWNPQGKWPINHSDLDTYYTRAEVVRGVVSGEWDGPAQVWVLGKLRTSFNAVTTPWGAEARRSNPFANRVYESPVSRLWSLVLEDHEHASTDSSYKRRIFVTLDAYGIRLEKDTSNGTQNNRIARIVCRDARDPANTEEIKLEPKVVVLAASTIESARLVLNSKITKNENVGCYLGDHIYSRWQVSVPTPFNNLHDEGANVLILPNRDHSVYRYQIDVRGRMDPANIRNLSLGITGSVAMEPEESNKVIVGDDTDEWGVPVAVVHLDHKGNRLTQSGNHITQSRIANVGHDMKEIEKLLDGKHVTGETLNGEKGRSHHEAGTLRMGEADKTSVTNKSGQFHDIDNLYVADASVFPFVGVANPMLTITAWGYRVACSLANHHFGERPPSGYPI